MTLAVIGSGFGRTGTKSLKQALEQIGFGPCHHMHEIAMHPEQVAHWQSIAAGRTVDWNDVFEGYKSQVDWPGADVWRELSAAYPEARSSTRSGPAESWWNSYSKTIGKLINTYTQLPLPPHINSILGAWKQMVGDTIFSGRLSTGTRVSELTTGTMNKCATRFPLAGCWCLMPPKVGNRCAGSSACRCQRRLPPGTTCSPRTSPGHQCRRGAPMMSLNVPTFGKCSAANLPEQGEGRVSFASPRCATYPMDQDS